MDPTKGGTRRTAPPSRRTPGTSEENPARRGLLWLATATRGSLGESSARTTSAAAADFRPGLELKEVPSSYKEWTEMKTWSWS